MDIVALLPFIVLIGAMFLMTRSAKNKQRAAAQMRDQMQPGTGVRTIGGLYATVKEVSHDTVVLEIAPGVHATFAKNAIGAVLGDEEYDLIVNGTTDTNPLEGDTSTIVPDSPAGLGSIDLGKSADAHRAPEDGEGDAEPADATGEGTEGPQAKSEAGTTAKDGKSVADAESGEDDVKGSKGAASTDKTDKGDEDGPAAR